MKWRNIFRFMYYWILFMFSSEIIYRKFFLHQHLYQIPTYWLWLALVCNVFLLIRYVKSVKNIRTS